MDAIEKSKWTEEAAKDKERFNKENAAYLAKKQSESIKADDAKAKPVGRIQTSSKIDEASGSDMDASIMLETMDRDTEEAPMQSEVMEKPLMLSEVTEEEVKEDVTEKKIPEVTNWGHGLLTSREKKIVKATARGSLAKEAKGKTSGKGKLMALKETVVATSNVGCSSSGEIPLPVAKYFAFLFSHWTGVRQVCSILFAAA